MRHEIFSDFTIATVEAIVRVFETGRPLGDPAAVAVLNDGAGISYGVKQFTHRSGSLFQVVQRYLELGGTTARDVFESRISRLRDRSTRGIAALSRDTQFKNALRDAGNSREMIEAQRLIAFERYMKPALAECDAFGFVLPLSLAVVYDSMVHGSWKALAEHLGPSVDEKNWVTRYVEARDAWLRSLARLRPTAYRTRFFLTQIRRDNWSLTLPLFVNGSRITKEILKGPEAPGPQPTAADPPSSLPETHQTSRDDTVVAAPAATLDVIEARVNAVAARVDQAERIVVTAATRTDKAKSLWTTVAGTTWQMAWAVAGVLSGIPREVMLIVALIAGALMVMFLYRQITLGRIREGRS